MIDISFDPAKRERTLQERGLDFNDTPLVFAGSTFEFTDNRMDYQETRRICVGTLAERMVIVGYVQRGPVRHIFSMRKANEREQTLYQQRLTQS